MGRIGQIIAKTKAGNLGFRMREVMSGEHRFEPGFGEPGKKAMEFCATWGPDNLSEYLNWKGDGFLKQSLEGTVAIEGLCKNAPCQGTLELNYFNEHTLRYTFFFKARQKEYRYVGEKVNIWPWNLPVSHTTCYGVVTEVKTGKLVSRSVTHFRLKTAPAFLLSLRLT
jgi:hypothetical protein